MTSETADMEFATRRRKLLFVFADDRFFWSHRLSVARAALRNGYEVVVATGVYSRAQQIQDEGFRLMPLKLIRKSGSPLHELGAIWQLRQIYKRERPEIVHQVAIKAVLYGSLASVGLKGLRSVNALTGLGYLVASSSTKATLLRWLVWKLFRVLLNRSGARVLVENQDDRQLLVTGVGISPEKVIVTRGSGVDIGLFQPAPEPAGIPLVILASRMLWIKGVGEFVAAARLLRTRGVAARFILAGDADTNNPSSVPREQLLEWQNSGIVEWWGHQDNMPRLFTQANLVCLPSHGGEGVPKVLMEAAASGRAIVTTDVPGCREVVGQGVNGLVVASGDTSSLADAIQQLLEKPETRHEMAVRSRELAVSEFSEEAVIRQTLALYSELLGAPTPPVGAAAHTATQL